MHTGAVHDFPVAIHSSQHFLYELSRVHKLEINRSESLVAILTGEDMITTRKEGKKWGNL